MTIPEARELHCNEPHSCDECSMLIRDAVRIRAVIEGNDETWMRDDGWFKCGMYGMYSRKTDSLKSSQFFSDFIYIYR